MTLSWLGPEAASVLYAEMTQAAPRLLEEGGWKTSVEFVWWTRQEPIYLARWPEGFALILNWYRGLSAEVHPVFLDWRSSRAKLDQFLQDLMSQLVVSRLEFRFKWPAKSLKKALAQVGAKSEGTARKAAWSYLGGTAHLINVEIWSILDQDLEVKDGSRTDSEDR